MSSARIRSVILLTIFVPGLAAAAQRTFVSAGSGSDANACSRQFPCRNFAPAIALADAGGEVVVLDSGGYGPVTITKSVTLVSPAGVYAGITAFTGDAIDIDAVSTDTVYLRGLTINGLGGTNGIHVQNVGVLHVESCRVRNLMLGLRFGLDADLFVKDSDFTGNSSAGILVEVNAGTAQATIDHCRIEKSVTGIFAGRRSNVTIRDSIVAGNSTVGLFLKSQGASGGPGELNIENCAVVYNGQGIACDGDNNTAVVVVRVSNTTIAGNVVGLQHWINSTIRSFGNNRLAGNATDNAFTNVIPLQ